MAEGSCPICAADVPIDSDDTQGATVYCTFCNAPLVVKAVKDDAIELDEDDY